MRRILSLGLALIILLGMFPITIGAVDEIAYPVEGGNIYFNTQTGTITNCDQYVIVANIPTKINGVTVNAIGTRAFAFRRSLREISLPDTITAIGAEAFLGCERLEQFLIPSGVTKIESSTFEGCQRLKEIVIPPSVVSIGTEAFSNCQGLKEITLSEGLQSIDRGAFGSSKSLTEITIPASVTTLVATAFDWSNTLTHINVNPANTVYSSIDGVLFDKAQKTLLKYPSGRMGSYVVPAGVTKIDQLAFNYCVFLPSIIIPTSVTEIGEYAFSHCYNLNDVYYEGSKQQWNAISIAAYEDDYFVDYLRAATLHCKEEIPASGTAYTRAQEITLDGHTIELQTYALKDEKGYETNYVKLRDIAMLLNGTAAQFNVGWDGAVNIITNTAYTANGSEMSTPFDGDRSYELAFAETKINGVAIEATAILLKDDQGGGYTYYKLRDLGQALGFDVSWVQGTGITIDSNLPYTDD